MTIKSADDLIVQEESKKLGLEVPVAVEPEKAIEAPVPDDPVVEVTEEPQAETESEELPLAAESEDAYGNKVTPPKMYSEEEVQRMIRERLARGRQTPEQQTEVQEAVKDFEADPESGENWETQLSQFIEKTVEKVEQKKQQKVWQERELASQAEFEDKFTTGMSKYGDFNNVVAGKPITASMMMATRSMEDPAAFIYAACKQQPAEVERIAKIADPYAQIAEMGRLEERMKKSRVLSSAPKPAKRISGDTTSESPKHSIDQLIAQHAKDKIMNIRPQK